MIPVSTGGAETTPFVLDTGSGVTVLAQSLVDRLGGKPAGRFTGFRLTGERIDLDLFTIPELRVGPVVRHDVVVAGWDGLDKFHLSGMIALDFFRDQEFTLDFSARRLVFESQPSLAARLRHGSVVKAQFDDVRGVSLDLFAPFRIDGKIGECEVDTGSQGYVFAARYMDALGLTAKSSGVKESKHTTILGNTETRYSAPVDSLTLGDTQIASSPHPSVLFENIIYDCNVGIDFWMNKTVTFDIPHKKLVVSSR
ncbi:MAG: retropepsin-like aspartic protease [Terracidiphilus sp.]